MFQKKTDVNKCDHLLSICFLFIRFKISLLISWSRTWDILMKAKTYSINSTNEKIQGQPVFQAQRLGTIQVKTKNTHTISRDKQVIGM